MKGAKALHNVRVFYPHVEKVMDASESLTFEITAENVETSVPKDHRHCVLATACSGVFPLVGVIQSHRIAYLVTPKNTAIRYTVPPKTSQALKAFDRGKGMPVGKYMLSAPGEYNALGRRRPYDPNHVPTTTHRKPRRKKIQDHTVRAALGSGRRVVRDLLN